MRRSLLTLTAVFLAALALPASAAPEVIDTPRGRVAGAAYLAAHYDRLADQRQREDYQAKLEAERAACPAASLCPDTDPYVAAWTRANLNQERGSLPGTGVAYELLTPKEGARSPVDGKPLRAPYPAVILLPGGWTAKEVYRGVAQGLAATGYAVVSVDPECNSSPCGPEPTPDQFALAQAGDLATVVAPIASSCLLTGCDYSALQSAYVASEKSYQAAGTAALDFLAAKPALFDRSRVGVVGHSLGAYNAALLAQRAEPGTVRAAVAWDGYGWLPTAVTPRVPVQFQVYEGQDISPHPFQPEESPSHDNASRLRAAGVPTSVVALRSSAHYEVGHIAYDSAKPGPPAASRKGERVALDATLAWLDAYVGSGKTAARGRAALLSDRLSNTVDAVAHGQGTEAADGSNVPYRVGGDLRADHLSLLLRSWYDLADGTACRDVLAGCSTDDPAGGRLVAKPGAPIHFSGVDTETGENSCTMSFLFTATVKEQTGRRGRVRERSLDYASTAGHCVLADKDATEEIHAPHEGPVVYLTKRGSDGALVAGPRIGRVVYTGSVQPVLYPDERLPELMDLALIELDPGVISDPAVCYFGGPVGLRENPLENAEDVHLYGNGNATGLNRETGTTLLPARSGPGGPSIHENGVSTAIASSGGDSGSPILDADGRALALLTGAYHPRIATMLARAQEMLGVQLSLRTAPLVDGASAFGSDPACVPL